MPQGQPDFVAWREVRDQAPLGNLFDGIDVPKIAIARVMAALSTDAAIGAADVHLVAKAEKRHCTTILRVLLDHGVTSFRRDLYRLNHRQVFQPTIWAFELKLKDWKRALHQSVQAKSYAHYSWAVFPIETEAHIRTVSSRFIQMGVGLAVFDLAATRFKEISSAKKSQPWSTVDYWLACMDLPDEPGRTGAVNTMVSHAS